MYPDKIFKIMGISLVIFVVAGYTIYQTYNLARGPVLKIYHPANRITSEKSLVEIRGFVKNASHITLNDHQIFIDENGKFEEKRLLSPGYNVFEIEINDKFERVKREKIELVYKPKKI